MEYKLVGNAYFAPVTKATFPVTSGTSKGASPKQKTIFSISPRDWLFVWVEGGATLWGG